MWVKNNRAYYADAPHFMLEEAYTVYRRFLLNKTIMSSNRKVE